MTAQEELEKFFYSYPSTNNQKGDLIAQPDLPLSHVYYLVSGYVRMYMLLSNGKELTITIFKPGTFFPLFLVLEGGINTYYFEAFTTCIVRQVPVHDVLDFVKRNQEVLFDFTQRLSRGMQGILENLQYQLFGTVTQRIIATIVMLATRFGNQKENGVYIILPVSHQDLANFVGVARETISIEMNQLVKRGLITTSYKHIHIPNLQKLLHLRDET